MLVGASSATRLGRYPTGPLGSALREGAYVAEAVDGVADVVRAVGKDAPAGDPGAPRAGGDGVAGEQPHPGQRDGGRQPVVGELVEHPRPTHVHLAARTAGRAGGDLG